jgi:hypothetical protein
MISHKHKFIFIHIPKTAGNSIQNAIKEYSDDKVIRRKSVGNIDNKNGKNGLQVFSKLFDDKDNKHATLQEYYNILGDSIFDYFIFTSIRCPFERIISYNKFFNNMDMTVGNIKTPIPAVDFISINNKIYLDDCVRFDHLKSDFIRICNKIDIKPNKLEKNNSSINFDINLDKNTRNMIETVYLKDFELYKNIDQFINNDK